MFWVEAGLFQVEHHFVDPPAIDGDQHIGVTRVAGVVPCGERQAADQRHGGVEGCEGVPALMQCGEDTFTCHGSALS